MSVNITLRLRVGQRSEQPADTGITRKQKWSSSAIILTLLLSTWSFSAVPQSTRGAGGKAQPDEQEASRPNILLIVADDLGYTDLGVYGSEIETPNLDELARGGQIFSQFYSSSMCSPTRAMLLSGMDNHRAGVGNLYAKLADNQKGQTGYQGYLRNRVASLPELLQAGGYHTYITGKWHLGESEEHSPAARGFEKSWVLAESGAGHFSNMQSLSGPGQAIYRENGRKLDSLPAEFYSTRFYADKMIDYIGQGLGDGRPFFAYLAFTAVHFPLQAPGESIEKYSGRYDEGYDVLHAQRFQRLKELGIIPAGTEAFPPLPAEKPWDRLTGQERRVSARSMEIYAAMIDDLDRYVGKVMDYLKDAGEYDNTLVFFMSDNGAEGHRLDDGLIPLREWSHQCCDNSYGNMGNADSYVMLGPNWARAATGPFRMFKGFTTEGGIRVPAFIHYPAYIQSGEVRKEILTVMDVMPTLLEIANISHPGTEFNGREVLPMQGRSLVGLLGRGTPAAAEREFSMGWELLGKRAYRKGDWKIVWQPDQDTWEPWTDGINTEQWQLYNLADDLAEMRDLSVQHPQKRHELISLWKDYVQENNVILPNWISGY